MDAFEYLESDGRRIADHLQSLAENYSNWSRDRVFQESKNAIEAVEKFIHKKEDVVTLSFHKRSQDIDDMQAKFEDKRASIDELIEDMVMIHVDEPGYEQSLERLRTKFVDLLRFCNEEFYPAIKEAVSKEELESMNRQLDSLIFS